MMLWFLRLFPQFRYLQLKHESLRLAFDTEQTNRTFLSGQALSNQIAIAALQGELKAAKEIADFFALRTFQRTIFEKQPQVAIDPNQVTKPVGRPMLTLRERQRQMQAQIDQQNAEATASQQV